MFRGAASSGLASMPRGDRRLAVLAQRTYGKKTQRATYENARQCLKLSKTHRRQHGQSPGASAHGVRPVDTSLAGLGDEQHEWVREEDAHRHTRRDGDTRNRRENKRWTDASEAVRQRASHPRSPPKSPQNRYGDLDSVSGESKVQTYFDTLVCDALLRFGPPLPAEFIADNHVAPPTTGSGHSSRRPSSPTASCAWRDDGADGALFHMYDEAGLKTSELLTAIRRLEPEFSFSTHCDGIPFALLIKNCSYLRAMNGKVNMMRYVTREADGRMRVSLAKYKMREVAPQDGIRQGPQPWLYGGRM